MKPAGGKTSALVWRAATYAMLAAGALLVSAPFYWLLRSSLLTEGDNFIWPPILIPNPPVWRTYVEIFQVPYIPLPLFFRNSVVLVVLAMIGEVLSTSMVGFAFGRLRWWGRNFMFAVLVATMFLPAQVTVIP